MLGVPPTSVTREPWASARFETTQQHCGPLQARAVERGNADRVVECAWEAAGDGHDEVKKCGYGGEHEEHFGLAPGVGLAVWAEVGGDASGEVVGAVESGVGDPEEDGEGG